MLDSCNLEKLPECIYVWHETLEHLSVSSNRLTEVTFEVGMQDELRVFNCSHNYITEISSALAECTKLSALFCNHNQLWVASLLPMLALPGGGFGGIGQGLTCPLAPFSVDRCSHRSPRCVWPLSRALAGRHCPIGWQNALV